jgi:hypothetical protein
VALVLAPRRSPRSLADISFQVAGFLTHAAADRLDNVALEALRRTIPAARSLPLLHAIARRKAGTVVLAYLDDVQMALQVAPC